MIDDAMRVACFMEFMFAEDRTYRQSYRLAEMRHLAISTGGLPLDEAKIAGANPNLVTCQRLTPLHVACIGKLSQATLVEKLVQLRVMSIL